LPATQWRLEFSGLPLYLKCVGRTYLFECPQCQYRAKVSGGEDSGVHCAVQTVICRDCRELFDVFKRVRRYADSKEVIKFPAFFRPDIPPVILNESSFNPSSSPARRLVWKQLELACPTEPKHFVEAWKDPGRCPRCGNFLEKNGIPFRLWD
jgi:hypothetical protein